MALKLTKEWVFDARQGDDICSIQFVFQLVPQIHNSAAGFKGFAGCAPYSDLGGIKEVLKKGKTTRTQNPKYMDSKLFTFANVTK